MEIPEEENNFEMGLESNAMNTGEYHESRSFLNDHLRHLMTTSVAFDTHEQLFWAGTQSGHMTSYYGPNFMKYTAFQAHHSEVREILPDTHGVLTLAPNQVRYTTKQGLKIFSTSIDEMHSMHSMIRGKGIQENYVLIAGENEYFFELDLSSGQVYKKSQQAYDPSTVVVKQSNHYICCGQKTGQVILHDPDSLEVCHTLEAHSGSLTDFDIGGNLLVTCGFSTRYNHYTVDPFLMVYDLRTLRAFPPVQVPIEPFFVRFIPTYTLRCLVVSQSGQFVLCQPDSLVVDPGIYQVNNQGAAVMDCCVSETYQCLGFGDAAGYAHIWSDCMEDQMVFNQSNQETVFANEIIPMDAFDIDDWSIPLTSIGLPFSSEPLLSDWPDHLLKRADRPTPPIDADILKNMTIRQFVGYAPNPKKKLRNQVAYQLDDEQTRGSKYYPESPMSREPGNSVIPKMYRKVEIKYSKYGVEDFNFKHYNQTMFSGLEIHIPNAYCNSMLQAFYFLDALRINISNHICHREYCLSCELGFLFYMLDKADGQTCQATNFLRTFRTLPEASALGLLISDNDHKNKSMAQTIQNWNRFVLRQLHHDTKPPVEEKKEEDKVEKKEDEMKENVEVTEAETKSNVEETVDTKDEKEEDSEEKSPKKTTKVSNFEDPSIMKRLFGMDVLSCRTCKCGTEHERKVTLFTTDLSYPTDRKDDSEIYPFTKLLQDSILRKQNTQAWCESCKKYQNSQQLRKILTVPDILDINCQVENSKDIEFWKKMNELSMPKGNPKASTSSPVKTCRYGKYCTRQACKFVHPGREGEQVPTTPTSELDSSFGSSGRPWLPSYIKVVHNIENHQVEIKEYHPDDEVNEDENATIYRLMSNVCHVLDPSNGSTLVAHVRVDKSYIARKEGLERSHWYVFNDFAITPISEVEALTFNVSWKIPCVLIYMRQDIQDCYEISSVNNLDSTILLTESLAMRQTKFSRNFTPLNTSEILKESDIVGVDAEFVTLNQEESEMRRDGTLSTLRPSQMSVARITVVRGWGPLQGVPFIDDYISTSEEVVDYLTKFSGIKPGDLDANVSSKHLTTLKTSYQKLRYLIDAKVLFIGHGLKKDFRVINLVIPRDQVVDTVELFHLPKQRFVSLKFLAWHFLNIKIQADTHDSAEDAYTAIKLYEKYRELLRAGEWVLEEELEILYDTGRQYNWQPPD